MVRILRLALVLVLITVAVSYAQAPAPAAAPAWQGKGKISGTVTDEAGKPVAGVSVKLYFPAAKSGLEVLSGPKGEWKAEKVAEGIWSIEFWKDGLDPKRGSIEIGGKNGNPTVNMKLTKEGTDPTFAVQVGSAKAQQFFSQQKFAEAVTTLETLLAKYPTQYRLRLAIATGYHMAKNFPKAIEQLRAYGKEVPADNDAKLMLARELFDTGATDEAWTMYSAFDATIVKDVLDLEEPGFALLKAKKPADALKYFDRAVALYPADAGTYYYRGLTYWQLGATVEKPNTPESKAKFDLAKADLTKFTSMAPNAEKDQKDPNFANFDNAKKMLAQIK